MRKDTRRKKQVKAKTPSSLKFEVLEKAELMKFLLAQMPQISRHHVKLLLKNKNIYVESEAISQFNHILLAGQTVEVNSGKRAEEHKLRGIKIIFEDQYLLVIEKEAGVLSIATDKQKENTAYSILSEYVKKQDHVNKIFVVHRLDKDTSGIMMYAKSQQIQKILQNSWNENILERTYLAVLEGKLENPNGTMVSYLVENKAFVVYSSQNAEQGKKAITHYETIKTSRHHCLLKVNLETGRKNQIRVHMKDLGHSVIGDAKYGATTNPIKRLGLHAWVLAFVHPVSAKEMRFETVMPMEFLGLFTSGVKVK